MGSTETENVRSVARALAVLQVLGEHPAGISLGGLARETSLPLSTLHRLLATLRAHELVAETELGMQRVGPGTVSLARSYLDGLELRAEALPILRQLVEQTGETCNLAVLTGINIVYVELIESPHRLRAHTRIGDAVPAVSTAAGRAMLAHSGAQAVEEIATQTARLTEAAVDPDELAATLAEVRGNGYGVDVEESSAGVCCVGAAVFDHTGAVTAAISISTPSSRFANDDLAVQGRAARVAADELSAVLGAPPDAGSRRSPHTTAFHRSSASASQGSSA